ncbi:hypothetical protein I4300191C4_07820 [Solibaculum mannosilyticum]
MPSFLCIYFRKETKQTQGGKQGMPIRMPDLMRKRIIQITLEDLRSFGIRGLLLDVDNTLASHGKPEPLEGVEDWITFMREAGIKMAIISNNDSARVSPFAKRLGLPFVAKAMKPLPSGVKRGVHLLGLPPDTIAVVGDQVYTDVMGAHLAGTKAVLVEPVDEYETWSFRLRRRLERGVIRRYRRMHGEDA